MRPKTSNANTSAAVRNMPTVLNTTPVVLNSGKAKSLVKFQPIGSDKMSQIRAIQESPVRKLLFLVIFCSTGDIVSMNGVPNVTISPRDAVKGIAVVICGKASSTTFPPWLCATM